MKTDSKLKKYIIWGLAVSSIAIYRLYIVFIYSAHTADIDQIVMWLYTAAASHFDYLWPYFPGQSYGSCLEALLAVPSYWLGIPLYIGLPLTTIILWAIPFVLCSYVLLSKNRLIGSYFSLLVYLVSTVEVDILSSIPRGFIPGITLAFIGTILLLEYNKNDRVIFISLLLFVFGYLNSQNSIAISLIGLLYWGLKNFKDIKKYIKVILLGTILGALLIFVFNYLFPKNHQFELVYAVGTDSLINISAFKENLNMIGETLSDYSIISLGHIPVSLAVVFVAFIVMAVYKKSYKCLIITLCSGIGTLCFFALTRTLAYTDFYLFKQSRMFLFIPVLILLNIYIYSKELNFEFKYNHIIFTVVIIMISIVKIIYFTNVHKEYDKDDFDVESYSVSVNIMKEFASYINTVAKENDADIVVISSAYDAPALRYTSEALNYGNIEVYTNKIDRFLNEDKLKKYIDGNVLVMYINEDKDMEFQVYNFKGTLEDVFKQLGAKRTRQLDYFYFNESGEKDSRQYIYESDY